MIAFGELVAAARLAVAMRGLRPTGLPLVFRDWPVGWTLPGNTPCTPRSSRVSVCSDIVNPWSTAGPTVTRWRSDHGRLARRTTDIVSSLLHREWIHIKII